MAKWIAIPHCVTIKAGAMGSVPVVKTWSVANKTVIGIDPNRRQFHFPCWISKTIPGVSFLESHNKIINILLSSNGLVDSAPASWVRKDRCNGTVPEPGGAEERRSGLLLRNFSIKKLPPHKWPSQLTHSLAESFCDKKKFKILWKVLERHSTKRHSTKRHPTKRHSTERHY